MKNIIYKMTNNLWDEALKEFLEYSETNRMDEESCIIGASIMEHYCEYDSMFGFISKGLKLNPCNYELYVLLGNYYSIRNIGQAYLSYENALYHCQNNENANDREVIEQMIADIGILNSKPVHNVSFVILSYNTIDYTKMCIKSIRNTCYAPCYEIIVVDNASNDGSVEWLSEQKDIILIKNTENKGFPVGCNQGIRAADPNNDIFLLNSDTIMLPNSLFWLRMGLYNDERTGASGAVSNYSKNDQIVGEQYNTIEDYIRFGTEINTPDINPYEEKSYLIMFAMLIKKECFNAVGLLDEIYTPGNYEDNDYGLRILEKGYKCVLCHNCYIYHFGSKSFGDDLEQYYNTILINREKFKDKWGFYDDYYTHARNDVISMIGLPSDSEFSVLEVGCGLGETLARIKYKYPNANVNGIEIVNSIASIGNKRFNIKCGDIETMSIDKKYDIILFPDVLEHLRDPESILVSMKDHINKNGFIISSIPNLMNASVIYDLLRGNFTYQDAGILDRTHLRFFTLKEIQNMFGRAGYKITQLLTTVSEQESTTAYNKFFEQLLSIQGVAPRELFDVYQFLVKATPIQ